MFKNWVHVTNRETESPESSKKEVAERDKYIDMKYDYYNSGLRRSVLSLSCG